MALPGSSSRQERWRRAEAVTSALDWLEGFPGDSWQDRWLLSGADEQGRSWVPAGLTTRWHSRLTAGMSMMIVLRAVRPGYAWMSASRLRGIYDRYRQHNQAQAFAELTRLAGQHGLGQHEAEALTVLTRIVIVTGKDLQALSLDDLAGYAAARRERGRDAASLPMAYELLKSIGGLPGAPPTWQQARSRGQMTVAELVDRYPIACRPVRDVLVHYLTERAAALDYGSLHTQVADAGRLVLGRPGTPPPRHRQPAAASRGRARMETADPGAARRAAAPQLPRRALRRPLALSRLAAMVTGRPRPVGAMGGTVPGQRGRRPRLRQGDPATARPDGRAHPRPGTGPAAARHGRRASARPGDAGAARRAGHPPGRGIHHRRHQLPAYPVPAVLAGPAGAGVRAAGRRARQAA